MKSHLNINAIIGRVALIGILVSVFAVAIGTVRNQMHNNVLGLVAATVCVSQEAEVQTFGLGFKTTKNSNTMLWTHRSGLITRKAGRIPKAPVGCTPTTGAYLSISK